MKGEIYEMMLAVGFTEESIEEIYDSSVENL